MQACFIVYRYYPITPLNPRTLTISSSSSSSSCAYHLYRCEVACNTPKLCSIHLQFICIRSLQHSIHYSLYKAKMCSHIFTLLKNYHPRQEISSFRTTTTSTFFSYFSLSLPLSLFLQSTWTHFQHIITTISFKNASAGTHDTSNIQY